MSNIIHPNIWYFPSAFGDIRLEQAEGSKHTLVIWYSLTPREAEAIEGLRQASLHWRRNWATKEQWHQLREKGAFKVGERTEHRIEFKTDLAGVAKILNKQLNPDRRTLHVMRIGQGKIEEIREEMFSTPEDELAAKNKAIAASAEEKARYEAEQERKAKEADESSSPARREAPEEKALVKKEKTTPAKVTTVKEPVRGCPEPDFAAVHRRAGRVLKAFLTPAQVADFEKYQRFTVRGADTGHQYMLTSRNAPDQLNSFGSRTVFDMTTRNALCVHDWDVPAEEELLSLAMLLQLPGRESWVRTLPEGMVRHPYIH